MSGTQYLSPLLQDPAWQALSRQLSVEARTAIFYLDELWKDEWFQRDWTRLKEAYFEAQREAIAVLRELHSVNCHKFLYKNLYNRPFSFA